MNDQLQATKEQLKTAIDRVLAAVNEYDRLIIEMDSPELPDEVTDFGEKSRLYNAVINSLIRIEETID